jgi:hypothetical protein
MTVIAERLSIEAGLSAGLRWLYGTVQASVVCCKRLSYGRRAAGATLQCCWESRDIRQMDYTYPTALSPTMLRLEQLG